MKNNKMIKESIPYDSQKGCPQDKCLQVTSFKGINRNQQIK
jgi:hypothetical protein